MNKKLQEGAESFKQFVLDECDQLEAKIKSLNAEKDFTENRYKDLQTRHQYLIKTTLALTTEKEILTKKLGYASNIERTVLLEKQNHAYAASHADLVNKNSDLIKENADLIKENLNLKLSNQIKADAIAGIIKDGNELFESNSRLRLQNNKLIKEGNSLANDNAKLRKSNKELTASNTKQITINGELIKFLDSIGYGVTILPVEQKLTTDLEYLKKLLSMKYHVKEVKPEAEVKYDIEFIKNLLIEGLGKDFDVHVIGGDK